MNPTTTPIVRTFPLINGPRGATIDVNGKGQADGSEPLLQGDVYRHGEFAKPYRHVHLTLKELEQATATHPDSKQFANNLAKVLKTDRLIADTEHVGWSYQPIPAEQPLGPLQSAYVINQGNQLFLQETFAQP